MAHKKNDGAWVLTREVNDYNQDGEYFVAIFDKKPSISELIDFFNGDMVSGISAKELLKWVIHVHEGGGRRASEDEWYMLDYKPFGKVE